MGAGVDVDGGAEEGARADADGQRVDEGAVRVDVGGRVEAELRAVVAVEGRVDPGVGAEEEVFVLLFGRGRGRERAGVLDEAV